MEFICGKSIVEMSNPGVVSRQLLNPENSYSERVTLKNKWQNILL